MQQAAEMNDNDFVALITDLANMDSADMEVELKIQDSANQGSNQNGASISELIVSNRNKDDFFVLARGRDKPALKEWAKQCGFNAAKQGVLAQKAVEQLGRVPIEPKVDPITGDTQHDQYCIQFGKEITCTAVALWLESTRNSWSYKEGTSNAVFIGYSPEYYFVLANEHALGPYNSGNRGFGLVALTIRSIFGDLQFDWTKKTVAKGTQEKAMLSAGFGFGNIVGNIMGQDVNNNNDTNDKNENGRTIASTIAVAAADEQDDTKLGESNIGLQNDETTMATAAAAAAAAGNENSQTNDSTIDAPNDEMATSVNTITDDTELLVMTDGNEDDDDDDDDDDTGSDYDTSYDYNKLKGFPLYQRMKNLGYLHYILYPKYNARMDVCLIVLSRDDPATSKFESMKKNATVETDYLKRIPLLSNTELREKQKIHMIGSQVHGLPNQDIRDGSGIILAIDSLGTDINVPYPSASVKIHGYGGFSGAAAVASNTTNQPALVGIVTEDFNKPSRIRYTRIATFDRKFNAFLDNPFKFGEFVEIPTVCPIRENQNPNKLGDDFIKVKERNDAIFKANKLNGATVHPARYNRSTFSPPVSRVVTPKGYREREFWGSKSNFHL